MSDATPAPIGLPSIGPSARSYISQRLRLHYADWGNEGAPVLILQHGGRDHCRSWDWVAERLRHDWHVIAPDMRGHGDSQWAPDGNYDMAALVYDFAQLVHTLDAPSVTIVAHSLGGNVATRYTGLYPEKVEKLVCIEGLGPSPETRAKREAAGTAARFRTWIEDRRRAAGRQIKRYPTIEAAYARMIEENSYLSEAQARHLTLHGVSRNEDGSWSWKFDNYLNVWPVFDLSAEQIASLWEAITCPTLLLYGTDSWATSPAKDGRIEHFRNASVIEFENAGHWLHHDQFDRFMTVLDEFL